MLPHPPGSVVRLFARGGDHREGDFARTPAEVRRFIKAYPDHNIYVAPNPTGQTGGARHSAKDVTHWSYLLIDMDPICTCKPTKKSCAKCLKAARPAEALEEALLWLGEWIGKDFSKNRPLTLDSGRGVQAWIRLEDWKFADDKADVAAHRSGGPVCIGRTIARRVNGYWLKKLDEKLGVTHGCRIDTSVSDLPRVMRCPGSINVKTGRMSKFINVTDRVFVGLAQLLTVGTPTSAMSDPESPKDVVAGQSWQMVFPHLTMMAQVYLTQGQAEPGRHKVMWHTAKKFRELGVSRREASRALKWANRLQGEEEELPTDQITHALDTAYNG